MLVLIILTLFPLRHDCVAQCQCGEKLSTLWASLFDQPLHQPLVPELQAAAGEAVPAQVQRLRGVGAARGVRGRKK